MNGEIGRGSGLKKFYCVSLTSVCKKPENICNAGRSRVYPAGTRRTKLVWHKTRADVFNRVFGEAVGPRHRHSASPGVADHVRRCSFSTYYTLYKYIHTAIYT